MRIPDLTPGFKQYLIFEKNLTPNYAKGILDTVELLHRYDPSISLSQYKSDHIRTFLYRMKQDRLWSPKTLRNYRQNLKTFFDFAVKRLSLKENPVEAVEKPRLPKNLPRCLTKEETRRLTTEVHCYPWTRPLERARNVAIIYAFLFTGLRLTELLQLKTHQVNFEESHCFVEKGKGRKDRYVPIHPSLAPVLKYYQTERAKKLTPSAYFFTSIRSDKPLTKKNLYTVFHKLSIRCDVKITPHMLRHTMAKMSLEADLNPFKLKEILGHSNITTTQIYMSVSTENIQKSFGKINLL